MKYYKMYMDRQNVSPGLHTKLMELGAETAEAGREPAKTKGPRWKNAAALAACCAVLLGVGLGARGLLPGSPAVEPPASPQPTESGSLIQDDIRSAEDFHGFIVPDSGKGDVSQFFAIPAVVYGDAEADTALLDIARPEGAFFVDLSEAQISAILWNGQRPEGADSVPWTLMWDGYTVAGQAIYDGSGDLWQVLLWGRNDENASFEIVMAPGALPPTCVVNTGAKTTDVHGMTVSGWKEVWDMDGDGRDETVYETAFLCGDVGVRCRFVDEEESLLSSLFVRHAAVSDGGLSLDGILRAEDVPAFRTADFASLTEARGESAFTPYLPETDAVPDAWEFYGHLVYQEGIQNRLYVRWSKGYDDVCIWVDLPESGGVSRDAAVDVGNPAAYDVRLYDIPWYDSVPAQYQDTVNLPAFWAGDMTREVVAAREMEKDTGGSRFRFQVIHPDGTLVEYNCAGLSVDQMWAMVAETLPD